MEIFSSRLFVNVVLLLCIFTYSIDGFSTRRKRLSRSSFKQIGNKGYRTFSVLDTLYNAYTYTTNLLNFRTDTTAIEGRQSSGVAGCKDCFMGLRVERREAIVEFIIKMTEWGAFVISEHFFYDPDLFETESAAERAAEL